MRVRGKITNKLSRHLFNNRLRMSYLHIPNKFKSIPNQHSISMKLLPYTVLQYVIPQKMILIVDMNLIMSPFRNAQCVQT